MTHPTILRLPEWFGRPEQILLPLPAAEYLVQEVHRDWWHVVAKPTGQTVYTGLGPIELLAWQNENNYRVLRPTRFPE
ncbi:hypothetical protein PMI14_06797 [Acidovorax sp. CF316]|uniref:hypothetical protein n=1 Tax=Acidovorax sp. CF316 TaxID=1144317 RepID=UPI00026BE2FE|nr:hypothetical protein [Acidovorax sp. CF316]EJE48769.1 hypothetical protein PMI14_06797 [Acidovorax sp. CF316]